MLYRVRIELVPVQKASGDKASREVTLEETLSTDDERAAIYLLDEGLAVMQGKVTHSGEANNSA